MVSNPIPGYKRLLWCPINVTEEQIAWISRFFTKVWAIIPQDDQGSILAHWDQCNSLPIIELWPKHPQRQGQPPAQTIAGGYGLSLDLSPLSSFPKDCWIELVIAEELAHNFLFATGASSHALTQPDDPGDLRSHFQAAKTDASTEKKDKMEEDAGAVLVRWKFSRTEQKSRSSGVTGQTGDSKRKSQAKIIYRVGSNPPVTRACGIRRGYPEKAGLSCG